MNQFEHTLTDALAVVQFVTEQFPKYAHEKRVGYEIAVRPVNVPGDASIASRGAIVVYKVRRIAPGSAAGKPFSESNIGAPRIYEESSAPATAVVRFYQPLDMLVQFSVYSKDYFVAQQTASLLFAFLMAARSELLKTGIEDFRFWNRTEDDVEEMAGEKVYVITQEFYLRTTLYIEEQRDVIRKILPSIVPHS